MGLVHIANRATRPWRKFYDLSAVICAAASFACLEVAGEIRRTGQYRNGQPVYVATELGKVRSAHSSTLSP